MLVGYSLGIALTAGLGLFVFVRAQRSRLALLFLLMNLAIAAVELSIVGVAVAGSARLAGFFSALNIFNIFIVVFLAHWLLEVIGKRSRLALSLIYGGGLFLFIYFFLNPAGFLLPPVPKLYLRHYFVAGPWYAVMRAYFALVTLYCLFEMARAYRHSRDRTVRNRLKYVFAGVLFGMVVGQTALLLVYDIPFDPVWSALFPLYTIPFAYAVIRYELMDIKIVAKRALFYALSVALFSALLGLVGFASEFLSAFVPGLPRSLVPVSVAALASALGFSVWFRLKEGETLKYEFITVVMHKFRTPLTEIKWTVESLRGRPLPSGVEQELRTIAQANASLVELTNTLLKAESEEGAHSYALKSVSLSTLASEALSSLRGQTIQKRIRVKLSLPRDEVSALADPTRLAVVLQTILENAIAYTPTGGAVDVSVSRERGWGAVSVRDSGIGIAREDLPHVFERFYRSAAAKRVLTEGMGIGLYIAKQIMDRHGGRIEVFSQGPSRGSTFTVFLPLG